MDPKFRSGDPLIPGLKTKKVQRACDSCRKKKTRCDGKIPCLSCIWYDVECTYLDGSQKAGTPRGYIQKLENRLQRVEKMLSKLSLDADYKQLIDSELQAASPPAYASSPSDPDLDSDADADADDEDDFILPQLTGTTQLFNTRFFGKSSEVMLVGVAHHIKQDSQHLHEQQLLQNQNQAQNQSQSQAQAPPPRAPTSLINSTLRAEYWQTPPWEKQALHRRRPSSYTFPLPSLLHTLTALYFAHANLVLPLLHRPTFTRALAAELHLHDPGFGAIVLLVCALGAKYSTDPRVLPAEWEGPEGEQEGEGGRWRRAGWEWFVQVQDLDTTFLIPATLYDVQFYCLLTQYLDLGSDSLVRQAYALIGIGVQMAQDVGAHRRKRRGDVGMGVEDELWKRAFWVLFCLDRTTSSFLGRPCIIQDEDFDIDLPIECDDEYWDLPSPSERFKQPPNEPCSITAFIIYIKLLQILGSSLQTIYSINRSKAIRGFVGPQWEQRTVAELDSALNKWLDSIPSYLRWDPQRQDEKTFSQAAWVYCTYYYVQIVVHKPFVPHLPVSKPSPHSFSSLAICTNAAKSCIRIAVVHSRRCVTPLQLQIQVFMSANLLLLNTWNGKQNGSSADPAADMVEVHQCMQLLKRCETRWNSAGRLWDILHALVFMGDLPLPTRNSTTVDSNPNKWPSDADNNSASTNLEDQVSASNPPPLAPPLQADHIDDPHARHIPENAYSLQPCLLENASQSMSSSYALPVYSEELARLPAATHGQVASVFSPHEHGQGHAFPQSALSFQGSTNLHVHDPVQAAAAPMTPATGSVISQALHSLNDDVGSSSVAGNDYESQTYPQVKPYFFSAPTTTTATLANSTGTLTSLNDAWVYPNVNTYSHTGMAQNWAEQRTPYVTNTLGHDRGHSAQSWQSGTINSDAVAVWFDTPSGFDLNEWGSYLENIDNLTHGS